jgi:hypothetical protein
MNAISSLSGNPVVAGASLAGLPALRPLAADDSSPARTKKPIGSNSHM